MKISKFGSIFLIFGSILITLLLVELILHGYDRYHQYRVQIERSTVEDDSNPVILVIGESTSEPMDLTEGDISWPIQLQEMLRADPQLESVKVVNLASGGITTAYLVEAVRTYLTKGRVDFLVSMMGINDFVVPEYLQDKSGLKLLKILQLAWDSFKQVELSGVRKMLRRQCQPFPPPVHVKKASKELEGLLYEKDMDLEALNRRTHEILGQDPELRCHVLEHYYFQRVSKYMSQDDFKKIGTQRLKEFAAIFLNSVGHDLASLTRSEYLLYSYVKTAAIFGDHDRCLSAFQVVLQAGFRFPRYFDGFLLDCWEQAKSKKLHVELFQMWKASRGYTSVARGAQQTYKNYQKIWKLVEQHNIKWIALQYPLQPIESLKSLVRGDFNSDKCPSYFQCLKVTSDWDEKDKTLMLSSIEFVSQEQSFRNALEKHKYNEIFLDIFGGDFGHATRMGNRIIASNVFDLLKERLKKRLEQGSQPRGLSQ